MTKVLQIFSMQNAKPLGLTLPTNNKLFESQCLKSKMERAKMSKVPYPSVVRSLIYGMVCTKSGIGYAIGIVT